MELTVNNAYRLIWMQYLLLTGRLLQAFNFLAIIDTETMREIAEEESVR